MQCPMILLCFMKCREPDHSFDGHCHNTVQSQFALLVQKLARKYVVSRHECRQKFPKWPQNGCLWRTKPMKLFM